MTEEQKKAIALANARMRMAKAGAAPQGQSAADRIAAAKANGVSPERLARQAGIDANTERDIRDPGGLKSFISGAADGATFGFADNINAGLAAGVGAARDVLTGNLSGIGDRASENYEWMRDGMRQNLDNAQFSRPVTTMAGQITGAVGSGLGGYGMAAKGLAAAAPAVNVASLPVRAGLGGVVGAAEGALAGAGGADGENVAEGAKSGAIIGGLAGMGGPLALSGIGAVAKVPANVAMSAMNVPSQTKASKAIEAMLRRSGMSEQDVARSLTQAAQEGQDVYRLADALGNAGQRGLAGIARQPGDTARQEIADFLANRQAGQGDRLSRFVADALDAPDTAAARTASLTAARGTAADAAYSAARDGAGPVDVRGVLSVIDDRIGPMLGSGVADDGISATLSKYRNRLAAPNPKAPNTAVELSDFSRVLLLKQEIGDDIGAAVRAGRGNEARELMKVQGALDSALEAASDGYRAANDDFAKASRVIDSVGQGSDAVSGRVRSEDTAAAWANMTPEQQAAFRAGYADPVIARIDNAAIGVNKARPLSSTKTAKDMGLIARDPELIGRQISRENQMFETNVAATGGSKTADNLADAEDMKGMSASMLTNLLSGRFGAAGTQIADRVMAGATGTNPATREIIAKMLLSPDLQSALAPAAQRQAQMAIPRNAIEALIRAGAINAQ